MPFGCHGSHVGRHYSATFSSFCFSSPANTQAGLENISTVIVGNKVDLEERRQVPKETGEKVTILGRSASYGDRSPV